MHTGIAIRTKGQLPQRIAADSPLIPPPNLEPVVSANDRLRLQFLAEAETQGLLLETYDVLRYTISFGGDEYRLVTGDEIAVRFAGELGQDITLTVRPDGRITLPEAGDVPAQSLTPTELAREIEKRTATERRNPRVTVNLLRSSLGTNDLSGEAVVQEDGTLSIPRLGRVQAAGLSSADASEKLAERASSIFGNKAQATLTRQLTPIDRQKEGLIGFDKTLIVSTDGKLIIPEIGSFEAAGKTISALREEIRGALARRYRNRLNVVLAIEASESRIVYIGGEVARPGAYPLSHNLTMFRALLLAGGTLETGDLKAVLRVHSAPNGDVTVFVTNLKEFVFDGVKGNDMQLAPQDIVLVAKTPIAAANQWIDQYINRMLPFSRGVSYSYTRGENFNSPAAAATTSAPPP